MSKSTRKDKRKFIWYHVPRGYFRGRYYLWNKKLGMAILFYRQGKKWIMSVLGYQYNEGELVGVKAVSTTTTNIPSTVLRLSRSLTSQPQLRTT